MLSVRVPGSSDVAVASVIYGFLGKETSLDHSVTTERKRELGRFLRNRRGRLRPHDVGLPPGAGHRRVAGLRQEEVAALAGVGVTWYTMLEKGAADGVSASTLDAIARALLLTHDETAYLHNLADQSLDDALDDAIAPLVLGAFASIEWAPAYICTAQWDVLRWNPAMSLVWGIEPPGGPPFNIVRRMFADERMRSLHENDFADFARWLVAMVRVGAGRLVNDPVYRGLYADLSADPIFAEAWESYDIATPFGSRRTRITSRAIGEFVYEVVSFPTPGEGRKSIVIQVPDEASGKRLRSGLSM